MSAFERGFLVRKDFSLSVSWLVISFFITWFDFGGLGS
jgi:hypothetical protein